MLMSWPKSLKIYTDGASRGNPGPSSIGVSFVTLKDEEVGTLSERIEDTTNNVAEYTALVRGLEKAKDEGVENVWVKTDSEFMVKQLKGEYKVKSEHLKGLHQSAYHLLKSFKKVKLEHIPREQNKRADKLANLALGSASAGAKLVDVFDDDFE